MSYELEHVDHEIPEIGVAKGAELLAGSRSITEGEEIPLEDGRIRKYLSDLIVSPRHPVFLDDLKIPIIYAAFERKLLDERQPAELSRLVENLLHGFTGAVGRDFPREGFSYLQGLQILAEHLPDRSDLDLDAEWRSLLAMIRVKEDLIPCTAEARPVLSAKEAFDQFRFWMSDDFAGNPENVARQVRTIVGECIRRAHHDESDADALGLAISAIRLFGYFTKCMRGTNYYCEMEFSGYQRLDYSRNHALFVIRDSGEFPTLERVLDESDVRYSQAA